MRNVNDVLKELKDLGDLILTEHTCDDVPDSIIHKENSPHRLYISRQTPVNDVFEFFMICKEQDISIDMKEDGSIPDCIELHSSVDPDVIRGFITDFKSRFDDVEDDNVIDKKNIHYFEYSDAKHSESESESSGANVNNDDVSNPYNVDDVDKITLDITQFDGLTEKDVILHIADFIQPDTGSIIDEIEQLKVFLNDTLIEFQKLLKARVKDENLYFKVHCDRMNQAERLYLKIFESKTEYVQSLISKKIDFYMAHLKPENQLYIPKLLSMLVYIRELVTKSVDSYLSESFDCIIRDIRSDYLCVKTILHSEELK